MEIIGQTRLDTGQIDGYRIEDSNSHILVRVFMGSGNSICINPKYEGMTADEIVKKLDEIFFEERKGK